MPYREYDAGSPEEWLCYAGSDLTLAETARSPGIMKETLCFHAQQAASTQLSMESLTRAFADINAALDDISTFRKEALPVMAENILAMDQMTSEAEERIRQQEQGNQAAPAIELDFTAA